MLGFFMLIIFQCSPTLESHYIKNSIHIDGNIADWQNEINYLEKGKLAVSASNTDEKLYLCMVSMDPRRTEALFQRGLTTWIDPSGGGSETFGIEFPLPNLRGPNKNNRNKESNSQSEEIEYRNRLTEFALIDNSKNKEYLPVNKNNKNVKLKIVRHSNRTIYELALPFNLLEVDQVTFDSLHNKTIGVGFELGEDRTQQSQSPTNTGIGTGRTNRRRRRSRQNNNSTKKIVELDKWIEVKLNQNSDKN